MTKQEHRGVEYRLFPGSCEKARKLAGIAGACRFVWNMILDQLNEEYERTKDTDEENASVTFISLFKRFTELRHSVTWLSEYHAATVRYILKYQADAWKAFFKGQRKHPKFKSKYGSTPSFTIPENIRISNNKLYIPKVGWMQIRRKGGNPYPDGKPIRATVKKIGRQWRVSILYEIDSPERTENDVMVGVDLNTQNIACTDSTGEQEMFPIPQLTLKEIRIKRYQRKLKRQQKGSQRRRVTIRKIAKWKRKQQNTRKNTAHQHSRELADKAETIVREDLKIKNMTKSAKGTVEKPGKNVKAKSGLNRVIQNAGWSRFNRYCDYKFKSVIEVDARYTSQKCSICGYVDSKNRKSQSKFNCMSCGHTDHADLNASANILASGIGATGRGGAFSLETPMSRQIDAKLIA